MRAPTILAVASATDLDFRYGCTPAWWQLWKALAEAGVDLIVTPYRGRAIESPWWRTAPNPLYHEAEAFAAYLRAHAPPIEHLDEVLAYECASLRVLLNGEPEQIRLAHEPYAILLPLVEGRLPESPPAGDFVVEVRPDPDASPAAIGHVLTST